jgi:uncharacterized protein
MRRYRPFLIALAGLFVLVNVIVANQAYHFTEFYDPAPGDTLSSKRPASAVELVLGRKLYKRIETDAEARPFRTIKLMAEDGLVLDAWYRRAAPRLTDTAARGTVILFHGFASSKAALLPVEAVFHRMGYHTLNVDCRAHGRSAGNACTIGFLERRDVRAAYDYVYKSGEINIVLFGESMGAAAVLNAVSAYSLRPHQLILEAPFGTLPEAITGFLRFTKQPQWLGGPLLFWGSVLRGQYLFGFSPARVARLVPTPTLLQWGTADPRVTRRETDAVLNSLATKQKRLVAYPGAGHGRLIRADSTRWVRAVRDFLGEE